MENYQFLKKFIFILLFLYFVLGIAAFPMGNTKTLIPFFSWFLYIRVPNETNMYAVRIYEYHGKKFDPPVFLHEAKNIVSESSSAKAREIIQRLGRSITNGHNNQIRYLRRLFEDAYVSSPAKYEIVKIKYNPIKLWNKNEIEVKSIKKFTSY